MSPGIAIGLGVGLTPPQGVGPTPSAQAAAFLARANAITPLSWAQRVNYINLINGLVASGTWAKFDALYLFRGAPSSGVAILNLVSSSFTATLSGTLKYAPTTGFSGNGIDTSIVSNFNPTTAPSPNFTQNSAHLSVWVTPPGGTLNSAVLGDTDTGSTCITPYYSGSGPGCQMRLNDNAASNSLSLTPDGSGFYVASRTSSSNRDGYWNGASIGNANSATSKAPVNANIKFIAVASAFPGSSANKTIQMGSIGGALTSADQAVMYALLTAFFANVSDPVEAASFTTSAVYTASTPYKNLNILSTADGVNFSAPGGVSNPVYTFPGGGGSGTTSATLSSSLMFSRGKYWICYEINDFSGTQRTFGISSAASLAGPWTWVTDVTMSTTGTSGLYVWNPHWFIDDDGSVHIIVYVGINSMTTQADTPYIVDCLDTTNYNSWSAPIQITGSFPSGGLGDFCLISPNNSPLGLYSLWYRKYNGDFQELATSASRASGYTVAKSNNVLGIGKFYEGMMPFKLPSGRWRFYTYPTGIGKGWSFVDSDANWANFTGLRNTSLFAADGISNTPILIGP